ncbi:chromatin modification-related protein EAF6/MEAF6 [bacterium]|nr:chromatin modification-related protein EAF6/MEAF6 [bacterium]|tara:strand:+ start:31493 stop:31825 length:333 start_codon:yes stop_codon:yes gene_type:complete
MSSTLSTLQQRKERLDEELEQVEKQVYDLETHYLNDSSQYGNVLKGFEGFLSQTKNTSQKKARNFKPEDRLFSLSSASSPVVDEIAAEQAAEKTVTTQSGRKAGGGNTYR